jgi:hypothetical protein
LKKKNGKFNFLLYSFSFLGHREKPGFGPRSGFIEKLGPGSGSGSSTLVEISVSVSLVGTLSLYAHNVIVQHFLFELGELLEHVIEDDCHAVIEQGLAEDDNVQNLVNLKTKFKMFENRRHWMVYSCFFVFTGTKGFS